VNSVKKRFVPQKLTVYRAMGTLKMRERKMRDCKNAEPDKERVTEAACEIAEM